MVGLVLASGTTVFALLDWTAFWRDGKEFTVCRSEMCQPEKYATIKLWISLTSMSTVTHTVATDA